MLTILEWLGVADPRYIPNALSGMFGFAGVVFTGFAAIFAWASKQALTRREKRNDLRYALWAEIEFQWRMLYLVPKSEDLIREIERRMNEPGGDQYVPFVSRYLESAIFAEVKSQITALGREEIPHIVRFYHHMAVLNNFTEELRSKEFATFSKERKLQMIRHLFLMTDRATANAESAIRALENLLSLPAEKRLASLEHEMRSARPKVRQDRTN